jgi:hypothetical protein
MSHLSSPIYQITKKAVVVGLLKVFLWTRKKSPLDIKQNWLPNSNYEFLLDTYH